MTSRFLLGFGFRFAYILPLRTSWLLALLPAIPPARAEVGFDSDWGSVAGNLSFQKQKRAGRVCWMYPHAYLVRDSYLLLDVREDCPRRFFFDGCRWRRRDELGGVARVENHHFDPPPVSRDRRGMGEEHSEHSRGTWSGVCCWIQLAQDD